jgi:hypothetical protein
MQYTAYRPQKASVSMTQQRTCCEQAVEHTHSEPRYTKQQPTVLLRAASPAMLNITAMRLFNPSPHEALQQQQLMPPASHQKLSAATTGQ